MSIDPGSRFTGYAVIDVDGDRLQHVAHGEIAIPAKLDFANKLLYLSEKLYDLLCEFRPQEFAIERAFLGKNADSAFKLGHVRGVCMQQAARMGSEVHEYAPRAIKKAVTGTGSASKEHVRLIALRLTGVISDARLDATDALAVGICHARSRASSIRLQEMQRKGAVRL